ncbi:cell wall-associated NlpC family hydrolase [Bacillus ectoiniformans]|nr:C40 family peptidase [Bacillus ectoiniformans]MBM7649569.1 cell wall-associated NlpC family hydrolase [Bacillus ectoiniformans]
MNKQKKWSLAFLSIVLMFIFAPQTTGAKEKEQTAYVNVSVATLWTEPNLLRELDAPSASVPADLRQWTSNMAYQDKLWLVGNLETQALYGTKVTILEEEGKWVKVAAHNQPTPRNELGYPGWMPKAQLADGKAFEKMSERSTALVTAPTAWVYNAPRQTAKQMEISFNTRLPILKTHKDWVLVMTPADGAKWLNKQDVTILEDNESMPAPTGQQIVDSGKQFLGLPYLWAGMSGFGFDCSGFTYTMYHANGITIPRDSSVQAKNGLPVERENLQAGDLLFFAYEEGKGRVHHVGMYVGEGKMIHSPNSSTHVRIDVIDESGYGNEYAGARRYIK